MPKQIPELNLVRRVVVSALRKVLFYDYDYLTHFGFKKGFLYLYSFFYFT